MPFKEIPPFYYVWASMKDRCYNPKSRAYSNYGGRGIKVCNEWRYSYEQFAKDMGPRPDGYSIDRVDNDGDYHPGNCRWADRKTQQRNQRRAVYTNIDGSLHRVIELSEKFGMKPDTILQRAQKGMSFSEVVSSDRYFSKDTSAAVAGHKAKAAARTHCRNGHEFTAETVHVRKDGARQCRICHNAKMRRLNSRKRLSPCD